MNTKHKLKGRTLAHSTIRNYIKKKKIGKLPEKRGPMGTLPLLFWDLLNCHVSMSQLEGKAETKPRHLKALIGAALMNTSYDHLNVKNIYSQFRRKYPATVCPTRMMEIEEQRSLWPTYLNVKKWFDGTKRCLIQYRYAEDEPMRVVDIFKGRELPFPIEGE
jgi:hypothetical protein